MGTSADIVAGIKTTLTTALTGATELPYGVDVAKNRFDAGRLGYAVIPGVLEQVEGVNRFVTVDQDFEVTLTESFGQSRTGDQAQISAASTLFGRIETLYTSLVRTKAGVPASVMTVFGLSVLPIEFLDANIAVLRATVKIRYRTAL